MEELEKAAELLLEDYDTLKKSDGYLYDLADILKQVLSNSSQKYHREMVSAYRSGDIAKFNEASDQFLSLIDKVEEVSEPEKNSCSEPGQNRRRNWQRVTMTSQKISTN